MEVFDESNRNFHEPDLVARQWTVGCKNSVDLKMKCKDTVGSSYAMSKGFLIIAENIATTTCDLASLAIDWTATDSTRKELECNRTTSAKIHALGLASNSATNVLGKGYTIDAEMIRCIVTLCRKAGQAQDPPELSNAISGLEIRLFLASAKYMICPQYDDSGDAYHFERKTSIDRLKAGPAPLLLHTTLKLDSLRKQEELCKTHKSEMQELALALTQNSEYVNPHSSTVLTDKSFVINTLFLK